jgi:hypothetical protein
MACVYAHPSYCSHWTVRRPLAAPCGGRSRVAIPVDGIVYTGCGSAGQECHNASWSGVGCQAGLTCQRQLVGDWYWGCYPPGQSHTTHGACCSHWKAGTHGLATLPRFCGLVCKNPNLHAGSCSLLCVAGRQFYQVYKGWPCGGEITNETPLDPQLDFSSFGVAPGCGAPGQECHDAPWSLFKCRDGLVCQRDPNYAETQKWTCVKAGESVFVASEIAFGEPYLPSTLRIANTSVLWLALTSAPFIPCCLQTWGKSWRRYHITSSVEAFQGCVFLVMLRSRALMLSGQVFGATQGTSVCPHLHHRNGHAGQVRHSYMGGQNLSASCFTFPAFMLPIPSYHNAC